MSVVTCTLPPPRLAMLIVRHGRLDGVVALGAKLHFWTITSTGPESGWWYAVPPFSVKPDGLKSQTMVTCAGCAAEKMPPPTVEAISPLQFAQKPVPVTAASFRVAVKGFASVDGTASGNLLYWLSAVDVCRLIAAFGYAQDTSSSM